MKVVALVTLLNAETYFTRGVTFRKNKPMPVTDRVTADGLAHRPGAFLVQYVQEPEVARFPVGRESSEREKKRQVPGGSAVPPGPAAAPDGVAPLDDDDVPPDGDDVPPDDDDVPPDDDDDAPPDLGAPRRTRLGDIMKGFGGEGRTNG